MVNDQKTLVDELKTEWKKLWHEKLDDRVRAEGIAVHDYPTLYVDKGTIVHATRDFKALDFKDVLQQSQVENVEKYISPSPSVGGWTKFIKTQITNQQPNKKDRAKAYLAQKTDKQQPKKGSRGWLHI
jgi:hypothetical protein